MDTIYIHPKMILGDKVKFDLSYTPVISKEEDIKIVNKIVEEVLHKIDYRSIHEW